MWFYTISFQEDKQGTTLFITHFNDQMSGGIENAHANSNCVMYTCQ